MNLRKTLKKVKRKLETEKVKVEYYEIRYTDKKGKRKVLTRKKYADAVRKAQELKRKGYKRVQVVHKKGSVSVKVPLTKRLEKAAKKIDKAINSSSKKRSRSRSKRKQKRELPDLW